MVNIERPYRTHGFTQGCLEHCNNLYINCAALKLVVHISNIVLSVLVQAASLYTYNKVRYWLYKLVRGRQTECTTKKHYDTNTMRSIMVNIMGPYLINGWTQGCLEHRSNLYINCTTL